jgi:hypothetical protein
LRTSLVREYQSFIAQQEASMSETDRHPSVRGPCLAPALAAVLVAVLPDCGGYTPTAPPPTATTTLAAAPTPPPSPTTLGDLSASLTSPQVNASLNCLDDVRVTIALTNSGGTDVAVRGILMRTGITAGNCGGDHDFTYIPRVPTAGAKLTTIVLDRSLYGGGPIGCCNGGRDCGSSCRIQQGFEVLTNLGNVPAGEFDYKVFFQNCPSCSRAAAASGGGPPCARMTGSGAPAPNR